MTNTFKIPSVNYHLWQACNMRCKFCFATFQDVKNTVLPKGHLPEEDALKVVSEIAKNGFTKITFAGGEPLLCPWLPKLIERAKTLGMTTMIVTNGSMLTDTFLEENETFLDWIAISIDSLYEQTNIKSGRAITGKKPISAEAYNATIHKIHNYNYGLKINTVVSSLNFKENMIDFIKSANINRWKVFQVLPISGQNDSHIKDLTITRSQFEAFIERHKELEIMVPESNDSIRGSYVMVDPAGRFFDNANGIHRYSRPILEVGIEEAIGDVNFCADKFLNRGGMYDWKKN